MFLSSFKLSSLQTLGEVFVTTDHFANTRVSIGAIFPAQHFQRDSQGMTGVLSPPKPGASAPASLGRWPGELCMCTEGSGGLSSIIFHPYLKSTMRAIGTLCSWVLPGFGIDIQKDCQNKPWTMFLLWCLLCFNVVQYYLSLVWLLVFFLEKFHRCWKRVVGNAGLPKGCQKRLF